MRKRLIITLTAGLLLASGAYAVTPYAYVINSLGESLSKINLTTGVVTNNILPLGSDVQSYPNQILVRDTIAYVVCSGTNEVQVIDLKTESTIGYISLPIGTNPYQMAFYNTQYAFVANLFDNSVSTLDLVTNSVVDTDSVGVSPEGIAIHGGMAWVVCTNYDYTNFLTHDGAVVAYSPFTDSVAAVIPVGHNPQYIAFDRQNRAHVICTGDYGSITGMAYRIDASTHSVIDSVPLGGQPAEVTIDKDGIALIAAGGWVTNGNIYSYNAVSGAALHTAANPLLISLGCVSLRAFQDGSTFAVTFNDKIDRIDSSGALVASYTVGDGPAGIDFNYLPGDANGDFTLNVVDLNYLIAWYFLGGNEPVVPRWRANVNGDLAYNVVDLNYLVAYLFLGGVAPKPGAPWLQ